MQLEVLISEAGGGIYYFIYLFYIRLVWIVVRKDGIDLNCVREVAGLQM